MLGILTLALALLLQTGYTACCLITHSKQPRMRHALRFAALGTLLVLLGLRVFEWSFRWIPLLIALSLLSAASVVSLLRRAPEKPFRPGWAVLSGVLGAALLFTVLLPAVVFPQYAEPAATGPYAVKTWDATYADESRIETYSATGERREVNVTFWYPEGAEGKFPLIIFSHGFCGIRTSNESTFRDLASHGYVVCSVDHPYQSFVTADVKGKRTFIDRGYVAEYAALGDDLSENLKTFQKWMSIRVADMSFVIDTVLAGKGGVYDLVDPKKIGAFGHSLGGAAAAGLPRVRPDIGAVVNLDAPLMCELTGVSGGRFTVNPQPYPAPILQVYSEFLYVKGIEAGDPEYLENRQAAATAPASFEVVFPGSQHSSLTDLPLYSPLLARLLDSGRIAKVDPYECIKALNRTVLSFFDCTLKGEGDFRPTHPGESPAPVAD